MWPFKRKPKEPSPASWKDQAVQQMREWRGIGDSFRYLGRDCVVTGYYDYQFHEMGVSCRVQLSADYADDLGRIRNLIFDWQEAQAVMRNNP